MKRRGGTDSRRGISGSGEGRASRQARSGRVNLRSTSRDRARLRVKPEGGPFADNRYEWLGAVEVLKVVAGIPFEGVGYRFLLFENPHARPTAVIRPEVRGRWPRYNPAGRVA